MSGVERVRTAAPSRSVSQSKVGAGEIHGEAAVETTKPFIV